MAHLYANENFPLPAVEELRRLGHDVLTIQETGQAGQAQPDTEVLAFAKAEQRLLLTLNRRHFIKLHNQQVEHCGIIACSLDKDFVALAQHFHEALKISPKIPRLLLRINRSA